CGDEQKGRAEKLPQPTQPWGSSDITEARLALSAVFRHPLLVTPTAIWGHYPWSYIDLTTSTIRQPPLPEGANRNTNLLDQNQLFECGPDQILINTGLEIILLHTKFTPPR